MPTYEYACSKCGHEFEVFQLISEKPLTICPKDLCKQKRWGKGKVKHKISTGVGLLFKGSGFYTTDYRSENYKQAARKESGATAPAASGGAEKKPAPAKTEAKPGAGKADKAKS